MIRPLAAYYHTASGTPHSHWAHMSRWQYKPPERAAGLSPSAVTLGTSGHARPLRPPPARLARGGACRLHVRRLHRLDVGVLDQCCLFGVAEDLPQARPRVDRPEIGVLPVASSHGTTLGWFNLKAQAALTMGVSESVPHS